MPSSRHHSHLSLAPLPTSGFQSSKVPNPFLAQGLHTVSSLDLECSSPGLRFHLSRLKMFSMILLMILIYTDIPKCIHHIFFNWMWNSNPAWTPSLGPWRLVALSSEHCGVVLWERGVRGWGLGLDEPLSVVNKEQESNPTKYPTQSCVCPAGGLAWFSMSIFRFVLPREDVLIVSFLPEGDSFAEPFLWLFL